MKDKKSPFILSRIQKLEWELGRVYHFKTPGVCRGEVMVMLLQYSLEQTVVCYAAK